MKKSILFAIPTLFEYPEMTLKCVNTLRTNLKQFNIDFKICIVINTPNVKFDTTDFGINTEKLCSNLNFNISKALNTAIFTNKDFDYFCYVDEGITINNTYWIDYLLELFTSNQHIGLVGCRPHGTPEKYSQPISTDPELYQVLWSDGIIFTKMKTLLDIDGFNEIYFGDCETQDIGLRLHKAGYINIFWCNLAEHVLIDYNRKSSTPDLLLHHRDNSRKLFHQHWDDFLALVPKYQ